MAACGSDAAASVAGRWFAADGTSRVIRHCVFRRGLSDSGYTDGKNVTVDIRVAEGKRDRLSELAADLVRKRVAVIVANTNATPYAISATKSIPIVFVTGRDPIAVGFVPNLNYPGGNVTGVSFFRF